MCWRTPHLGGKKTRGNLSSKSCQKTKLTLSPGGSWNRRARKNPQHIESKKGGFPRAVQKVNQRVNLYPITPKVRYMNERFRGSKLDRFGRKKRKGYDRS